MEKKHIIWVMIGLLILFGITTSFLKSISGAVVDEKTGMPVEGAVVLIEWTRRVGVGDYHTISVRVGETITDKDGKFWIAGPIHPFVDQPSATIYKKGYVAWNNKWIFPNYKNRPQSEDMYQTIRLEHYKLLYSHNQHVSFIGTCIADAFASYKKKEFAAAYGWEIELARKEAIREK